MGAVALNLGAAAPRSDAAASNPDFLTKWPESNKSLKDCKIGNPFSCCDTQNFSNKIRALALINREKFWVGYQIELVWNSMVPN